MMGSFRRPRPRFMSSPVLSDLARFHASSPSLSNTSVWNRWLLKTEVGSFITDYFQNQLLTRGLSEVLDQVQLHSGDEQLVVLGNGVHDAPSLEFCQLERLVEVVVKPFIRDALLTG
ncbi:Proline-rich protein 5-like [Dissostichus eleginoides]|uniref:Proline-rich protein 5-like n=1 Tax=Dissostichus eleginoides TaxID=100907 RepID=A0AAD9BQP0_DISEL|nr:Proline-rich protein 5-like [Dissostichus eleginoides]